MRQTIIHILTVLHVEVPERRQRHRPNYSDPPSHSVDFIRQVSTLTADELTAFDAWCLQRALPLNLDSRWRWERERQHVWSPLPARYNGPERRKGR